MESMDIWSNPATSKKPPAMPSKSSPAPTAAAKWAKPPASTPRKNSAPTTSSPPTKTTTSASSPNPDYRVLPLAAQAEPVLSERVPILSDHRGTRDSASAAASWCRLLAGENHVQFQTSFVVAASSGMDFAGEGAVRAHRPQTDCRCGRQTAPSSRYKPGQLDGARGLYVAVPGRPAIS